MKYFLGVGMAVFISFSAFAQVPTHLCDYQMLPAGHYTIQLSDLSEQQQYVAISRETPSGFELVKSEMLQFTHKTGNMRFYSNNVPNDKVELAISPPEYDWEDLSLNKSAIVTFTDKKSLKLEVTCKPIEKKLDTKITLKNMKIESITESDLKSSIRARSTVNSESFVIDCIDKPNRPTNTLVYLAIATGNLQQHGVFDGLQDQSCLHVDALIRHPALPLSKPLKIGDIVEIELPVSLSVITTPQNEKYEKLVVKKFTIKFNDGGIRSTEPGPAANGQLSSLEPLPE